VVVDVTNLMGNTYMGSQVPQRDEEFHQIPIVPKYIIDVSAVTEMQGWPI